MQLMVFRRSGEGGEPRHEVFEVEAGEGMTVLDALFQVREKHDDSLAFRYSCRGAVCGSCAMMIDGWPRLACRTQVADLLGQKEEPRLAPSPAMAGEVRYDPTRQVLVEPLPNLRVVKDLVVDQSPFFDKYRALRPFLLPRQPLPERESTMRQDEVRELERFTNCIMCAACYGACPVNAVDQSYAGPAALAKLYRFIIDPRDAEGLGRVGLASGPFGWEGCRFYANCAKVCPKQVPPNYAISKARKLVPRAGEGSG